MGLLVVVNAAAALIPRQAVRPRVRGAGALRAASGILQVVTPVYQAKILSGVKGPRICSENTGSTAPRCESYVGMKRT
jgi:hypothetical protein